MTGKPKQSKLVGYTIYAIIGTALELIVVIFVILWGLPLAGIHIPLYLSILIIVMLLAFDYFTYHMGMQALKKRLIHDMGSLLDHEGIVVSLIDPVGYVRVGNELWKATSTRRLEIGETVIVKEMQGLKIIVAPKACVGYSQAVKSNN